MHQLIGPWWYIIPVTNKPVWTALWKGGVQHTTEFNARACTPWMSMQNSFSPEDFLYCQYIRTEPRLPPLSSSFPVMAQVHLCLPLWASRITLQSSCWCWNTMIQQGALRTYAASCFLLERLGAMYTINLEVMGFNIPLVPFLELLNAPACCGGWHRKAVAFLIL